jgi:NAD(P)-dependent dehydrogenase (short-subunit alcohol dehydrogenase family)
MVRVALITGASRGIGAATALVLAEHGYRVVVNHRASAPQAEEVVATIVAAGGEAVAIKADVTVPDDVTAMVDEIDQRWSRTDVLVHNALTPFAITSFAELSWAARRQAGQRAARRVPDNEGRCAGNDFARIRSADLSEYRAVASCA